MNMTPTTLQLTTICASLERQGFHVERPESELVISNEWLGKMLRLACEEAGRELNGNSFLEQQIEANCKPNLD